MAFPNAPHSRCERKRGTCPSRHAPPVNRWRPPGHDDRSVRRRISRRPARASRAPSSGLFKDRPSVVLPSSASSRRVAPASARSCQRPNLFRLRGFSPPCRLAPPNGLRACCIPLPTLGFVGFRAWGCACLRNFRPSPPTRGPPERVLPQQPTLRCRSAVPPCRSPPQGVARLRGLDPLGSSWQRRSVAGTPCSKLSWASHLEPPVRPLRVPP